jgi:hypothetical protein
MFADCDEGQSSFKDASVEQQLSVLSAVKQVIVDICQLKVGIEELESQLRWIMCLMGY